MRRLPLVGAKDLTGREAARPEPSSVHAVRCESCGRSVDSHVYDVRTEEGTAARCLFCALRHGRLVRRSLTVAAVVGTLLIAINQGDVIVGGDLPASLVWKMPLTYTVPYSVATFGAIMNARRQARHE